MSESADEKVLTEVTWKSAALATLQDIFGHSKAFAEELQCPVETVLLIQMLHEVDTLKHFLADYSARDFPEKWDNSAP